MGKRAHQAQLASWNMSQAGEQGWGGVGTVGTLGLSLPPVPSPVPTCAAKGHSAHSHQVDGISLVPREQLQPHVTDADKQEGAQGQEVACGGTAQRRIVSSGLGAPTHPPLSYSQVWGALSVIPLNSQKAGDTLGVYEGHLEGFLEEVLFELGLEAGCLHREEWEKEESRLRGELRPWHNGGHTEARPGADNMLTRGVPSAGLTLLSHAEPHHIPRRCPHSTDKGSEAQGNWG